MKKLILEFLSILDSIHYRMPENEGHTFHCRAAFTRARHNKEKLTSYPLDSQCPNIENSGSFLGRQAGPCGGKTPQTNSVTLARKRRKTFFPSLAFSESPRYEMCSIAPNKLHNNFKLSYAEGVSYVVQSSHLKIKRSSNLTGILPKTF